MLPPELSMRCASEVINRQGGSFSRPPPGLARSSHGCCQADTRGSGGSAVVRREIVEQLGLREPLIVASGFDRPNIRLEVSHRVDDDDKRAAALAATLAAARPALLYTATRADAEGYAAQLNSEEVQALAYHAGLSRADRDAVHTRFRAGEVDVVAATSAFGMGIDKSDVRTVVHASIPDSVDNYYQQIGRAGRDGQPAVALLFYRPEDLGLGRFFASHNPDPALLACVYSAVQSAPGPRTLADLHADIDAPERRVTNVLNLLEQAGLVRATVAGFLVARRTSLQDAVTSATAVVERLERIDRTRVEMMRGSPRPAIADGNSCSAISARPWNTRAATATVATTPPGSPPRRGRPHHRAIRRVRLPNTAAGLHRGVRGVRVSS